MSALQDTAKHHHRFRIRGAGALALSVLVAIGAALLILIPTGHRATARAAGSVTQPASHLAITAYLTTRSGYFRDPATHKLLRIHRGHARHLPPVHPSGGVAP